MSENWFSSEDFDIEANDFADINEEFYEDIVERNNAPRLDFVRMMANALSINACAEVDLVNPSVEWCREWSVCSECGRVVYAGEMLIISKKADTEKNRLTKVHRCEECGKRAIEIASKYDDECETEVFEDVLDDYMGGY